MFVRAYDFWASVCPFHESVQLVLLEGLEKLTFGSALFTAAAKSTGQAGFPEVNAKELSHLARAVESGIHSDEQLFIETLRRYLAGFRGQPLRGDPTLTPGSTTIPLRRTQD